jgi:hypothetical protein
VCFLQLQIENFTIEILQLKFYKIYTMYIDKPNSAWSPPPSIETKFAN